VSFYHGEIVGNGTGVVPGELTTKLTEHLACMKGTEKGGAPCIALRHTEDAGWRCSIYEERPSPCREFNIINDDGTLNEDCQRLQKVASDKKRIANQSVISADSKSSQSD
jgi:Fe-S-cluster containining protein